MYGKNSKKIIKVATIIVAILIMLSMVVLYSFPAGFGYL